MSHSINLKDKVAIITGASKGIGEQMALSMAECGAHVIVSSRKQDAVQAVAEKIIKKGHSATAIECHVGYKEQLESMVHKVVSKYGGVDILVNNAAINPTFDKLSNADEAVFDKIMNVNVKACMTLGNMCYPSMVERGGGSVINIASVEGLKPSFGLGLYSISKAALIMLTKSQAKEWGRKNIRSNAICPGLIKTKFSQALWSDEKTLNSFTQHLPMQRMGTPEEMVGIALYLASDSSSYTTGGVYTSDGGYMMA